MKGALKMGGLRFWAALAVLALTASGLGAETLGLDAAVDRALRVNVDYARALWAADQAEADLVSWVNWKGVAVSATRKEASSTAKAAGSSTTSLGLTLPLFDQVTATASVDQAKTVQAGVTLTPLAHSSTAVQARVAYDQAVLTAVQARATLTTGVRQAYLAQQAAQAKAEVQARQVALKETAYLDAKARLARGLVTLAEVRAALKDWTDARASQTTLDRALVQAKATLAGQLQLESVETTAYDPAAVQAAVEALGPVPASAAGTTTSVQLKVLDAESKSAQAAAVWVLDPNLAVSANAVVPATGTVTWNGSVTLSLALGDWKGGDRALADRAAALASQAVQAAQTAARASEAQARLAVQAAQDTVESQNLALTQAQDLLTETQLLAKAGKASDLEVDDAALGVEAARINLFSAWADLYSARLDLEASRS